MFVRKAQSKKKGTTRTANGISLDSSLTSMDWLPVMQIGENPLPSSTTPPAKQSSLPITNIQQKIEAKEIELPTSTVHLKPPYSYVTLIRQAILGASMQRMTLNQIYKWIVDSYPYFRTAPPKWKV
jgi:forkhead transcription factor HCM1